MKYRGTIAYRTNSGGAQVYEGFMFSFVQAFDFLLRNMNPDKEGEMPFDDAIFPVHVMRGQSCFPDESANQIAEQFLGDWVLMLDTDHVFAQDAFLEMVTTFEDEKLDVLVGFTQKRFPPYSPVIYRTDFDAMKDFETIFPNPIERQALIPIDSSGAACLMVRRTVFDEIKKYGERPFDRRQKFNQVVEIPKGRSIHETFGEDTSFFWRCRMAGFRACCAPWIKFHHLTTALVDESMMTKAVKDPIPQ